MFHAAVKVPLVEDLVQPVVKDIGRRLDDITAGHPRSLQRFPSLPDTRPNQTMIPKKVCDDKYFAELCHGVS